MIHRPTKRCIVRKFGVTNATRDNVHVQGEIAERPKAQIAPLLPRKLWAIPTVAATIMSEMNTSKERAAAIVSPNKDSHSE
jgi:hypothetical protein